MKQYWQRIASKIDARTMRERVTIFTAAAAVLITLSNAVLLDPQSNKLRQLSQRVKQDQARIAELQAEIQTRARLQAHDPDEENRKRLQALKQQSEHLRGALHDMQKGLVSPDKMAELLEAILQRNAKLRLVSLKTLPVSGLMEQPVGETTGKGAPTAASPKDKSENQQQMEAIYKHGVEMTLEGRYPDLINWLSELEAMPWQLFWSNARFRVDEYPKTTLTLTLYTLSLDKRWLNI